MILLKEKFKTTQLLAGVTSYLTIKAVSVALFMLIYINAVIAGSPVGDLENRHPCRINNQVLEIEYEYQPEARSSTVSMQSRPDNFVIVVNEQAASRHPRTFVTFEYFSACHQVQLLKQNREFSREFFYLEQDQWMNLLFQSDCRALQQMRYEKLLFEENDYKSILNIMNYDLTEADYYGVSYQDRAKRIREECRIFGK